MSLKPFFCYFGGKFRAAPNYPAPTYDLLIEPFAGAAGYATRYPERNVLLYDVDPVIAGIWRYLVKAKKSEIRRLPARISHVDSLKTCEEAKWLIGFWLNKGVVSPCKQPSKWAIDDGREGVYWGERVRDRIAEQVGKIRHWRVFEMAYPDVADRRATWFIDPPYAGKPGANYRYGIESYADLGRWCRKRTGQTIVCERQGALWLPFQPLGTFKANESKHGGKISKEVVWLNERN